jgi:4a-hydroxytetrahydrobiopterin dehydratase
MVVNAIGWACEAGFHHPDLEVHYGEVTVRLSTHSAGGVTAKDLAMARHIESIVGWTPGDDDPLDPPPDPLLKAD